MMYVICWGQIRNPEFRGLSQTNALNTDNPLSTAKIGPIIFDVLETVWDKMEVSSINS